jgi:uncharacterized FlaG/YvyC family protein
MSDYSINSVSSVRVAETAAQAAPSGAPATQGAPAAPATPVTSTGAIPSLQGRPESAAAKQAAQTPGQTETVVVQKHSPQKAEEQKKAAAEAQAKKDLPIQNMDKVTIRFAIDDKTKSITVYVIDKVSRRVVRAIPPEDLNKMQAGDLLQLLA